MKTINDLKKALRVKEGKLITIDQLVEAREIYKEIAEAGHAAKNYTKGNIALSILDKAFMRLLDTNAKATKDLRRTIFIQDNGSGYNCILSKEVAEGKHENVLSVKFKSESVVESLIDDYDFYLVG